MDEKRRVKVDNVDRASGVQKSNPVSNGSGRGRTWVVGGKVHSIRINKPAKA